MEETTLNQVKMNRVRLRCPIKQGDLNNLSLGDLVFLDGMLFTGREGAYMQDYMSANPQVQAELQAIRQPMTDFRARCGMPPGGLGMDG